jgi:hypothetical protein
MLLTVRDSDDSSRSRCIGWDTSMPGPAPSPYYRISKTFAAMPLGDCAGRGFPFIIPSALQPCPIEEMPHDDVASFCLAAPWNCVLVEGSGWAPLHHGDGDMYQAPWSGLICDEKNWYLPMWWQIRRLPHQSFSWTSYGPNTKRLRWEECVAGEQGDKGIAS